MLAGTDDREIVVTDSLRSLRIFAIDLCEQCSNGLSRPPLVVGHADDSMASMRTSCPGGRLVRHARYYWLLLAESHLPRRLFGSMLQRIWALPVPTG
jgi:hypothetical protein